MVSYDLPFRACAACRSNTTSNTSSALSAIRHAGFGENYGVQILEGPLAGMFARAVVVIDENNTVVHVEQIEDIANEPDYEAAFRALGYRHSRTMNTGENMENYLDKLIFEKSRHGRRAFAQAPVAHGDVDIPQQFLRKDRPRLPEASELQTVRHFTRLSQKNFSIDTQFYPLGSCTMKYNPRACNSLALLPGFANRHPLGPVSHGQGFLSACTSCRRCSRRHGMQGVSLTPMAGAQGEFAGVAMIQAYHAARGDHERNEILVPDAAHGTNPATATMCGCIAKEIPTGADGDVDIEALKAAVGRKRPASC